MRFVTGRTGRDWLRPAVFCILALFLLGAGASASGQGAEEAAIRAAVESYLRAYQEKAMLYEDRDLRAGTVIDPDLHMPLGSGEAVFRFSGKDVTLSRLQSDMAYLEQKAAFYAGMRQMQEIYRENLRLTYALEELDLWVALDTDIRTTLQHMDFLDPDLLARDTAGLTGQMLMEISYSSVIPDDILCLLEETAPRRRLLA